MEDDDFDLAFSLYDRPKTKLVAPSVGFSSRFVTTSTPSDRHQAAPHLNASLRQHAPSAAVPPPTASGAHTFRANYSPPSTFKSPGPAPLNIVQAVPSSMLSSNRPFVLPAKSTHSREPHTRVIQLDTPQAPAKRTSPKKTSSIVTHVQEDIGWFDEDDVLAPVAGISREPKTSAAKKATSRSPASKPRQSNTARNYQTTFAEKEDLNHSISLGAADEVPTLNPDHPTRGSAPECDPEAIRTWEYPSNYEKRDYQFAMVESALFRNSLICLPTGLGKTLIAAVVMYNFYRWFPRGKIIFMAPNRPLVGQQIEACRHIVSIPASDSIAMTGKMSPENRAKNWTSKRIFFVTPEIPQNDIRNGICPAEEICLLVIDEAHRAHGDYAYCEVVRQVNRHTPFFRVMALSATPGADFASIQEVLSNLLISKIELRTEESPDVKPHMHRRVVEEVAVKLDGPTLKARELLKAVISLPISWLQSQQVLYRTKKGDSFTFNRLKTARDDYRANPNMQRKEEFFKANVEARFATAMSLYSGSRLISDYGMGSFKEWLNNQSAKPILEKTSQFFANLIKSSEWQKLSRFVNEEIGDASACRHPKMTKLEGIILDHFQSLSAPADGGDGAEHGAGGIKMDEHGVPETRVMIFAHFRDTVEDIVAMLKKHEPFIRPMVFVGQAKKGLSQKQQGEIVKQFRTGHFNTLVATSIGEEGLDIGEVDLIVCYDVQQSPIRMIQRMGRTGRKRNGRCVMLLTEGSEDGSYKKSKVKGKTMMRNISNSSRFNFYNAAEPNHLLPAGSRPVNKMCHMIPVNDVEPEAEKKARKPRAKKASAKRSGAATAAEDAMMQEEDILTDAKSKEEEDDEDEQSKSPAKKGSDWANFEIEAESDLEDDETVDDEIERILAEQNKAAPARPSPDTFELDDEEQETLPASPKRAQAPQQTPSLSAATASSAPISAPLSRAPITSPPVNHTLRPIPVEAPVVYQEPKPINADHKPAPSPIVEVPSSVAPQRSPFLTPAIAPSPFAKTSTSSIARREPSLSSLRRSPNVLDQSQSLDSSGSLQVPLDDFPLGFLEDPRAHASSSIIPPPPLFSDSAMDSDLGLIPLPPSSLPAFVPAPPTIVDIPGQAPFFVEAPAPSKMMQSPPKSNHLQSSSIAHLTSQRVDSAQIQPQSANTVVSTPKNRPSSSRVIAEDTISPPKRPATASSTDLSNSVLSAEDGLSPGSPQFKRLKRVRSVEDEEELDPEDLEVLSPPIAKRSSEKPLARPDYFKGVKKRKSRFFDEEASLDVDNSDGEPSVEVSGARDEDVPNSQDLAFIASDGESDLSTTGMRAVYAKSLGSPGHLGAGSNRCKPARGVGSLDWLEGGEGLQRKMAEWEAYSDVEASSDGNDISACTVESIGDISDAPLPIINGRFGARPNLPKPSLATREVSNSQTDPVVISSPESSPQLAKPPQRVNTTSPFETRPSFATSTNPMAHPQARTSPPPLGSTAFRSTASAQYAPSAHTLPKANPSTPLSLGKRSTQSAPSQPAPPPRESRVTTADVLELLEGLDSDDLMSTDGVY